MTNSIIIRISHQQETAPLDSFSKIEQSSIFEAEGFDINPLLHSLESTYAQLLSQKVHNWVTPTPICKVIFQGVECPEVQGLPEVLAGTAIAIRAIQQITSQTKTCHGSAREVLSSRTRTCSCRKTVTVQSSPFPEITDQLLSILQQKELQVLLQREEAHLCVLHIIRGETEKKKASIFLG